MAENEEELVLLERVFLRIGSADTDEQFEKIIGNFLTPILLKLSSQVDGVRKKVMELLVHVNKRLKSRPKIQLPMDDLFVQYMDPNVSAFVTNFSILYIKMGYPRLDASKQAELVPQLLLCLNGKPEAQQNSFFQLLIPALPHVTLPSKSEEKLAKFGLAEFPKVRARLLEHLLDFLLLPYNYAVYQERAKNAPSGPPAQQGGSQQTAPGTASPQTPAPSNPEPTFNGPPSGLSEAALKKVLGEAPPSPEDVEKMKRGIVEFLGAEVYPKTEVMVHFLVATADTRYSVATAADRELKRMAGMEDWNNSTIVNKLFSVFQGTVAIKGKPLKMKSEHKRTPASIQLRLKIFPYLLKSKEAPNQFPACVQIVFDCLYGANTNTKMKSLAVQFVHHLCLHCANTTFRPMGAVLLSGMIKLISESKEDAKLRMLCYMAVGKISKRAPQLVTRDMTLLQNFFDAISKEAGENRLAVQEALSMMSEAFKNIDQSNAKLVEALIMQNVDKEEPQARQMAVEYAKMVFPSDHIQSRYVLLLACGDVKDEISGEAMKTLRAPLLKEDDSSHILRPADERLEKGRPLPPFTDMIKFIQEQGALRIKTQHKFVHGNNILPFKPAAYTQILMYLRTCLAYDSGVDAAADNVADMQTQAPAIGRYIKTLIGGQTDIEKSPIAPYVQIIKQLLSTVGGGLPMYCLLELVAVQREHMASSFVKNLDWIKSFMFSVKEDIRLYAAELYALVVATAQEEKVQGEIISELCDNLKKQALEGQHGSLLCLGYLIGYLLSSQRSSKGDLTIEDMETDQSSTMQKEITKAVISIVGMLDSSQNALSLGACVSLGELGRCGALPLPDGSPDDQADDCTKLKVVETLIKKLQSGNVHAKIREQAATCLGFLCVGDEKLPHREKIILGLLDSAAAKQFELHFTIGDALVCCAQGVTSPNARDKWTMTEKDFKPPSGEGKDEIETLLKLLLEKYSKSQNPHIRQAACIWLVSLSKKCGSHSVVQKALYHIQQAFMNLLAESDELTQDLASKGLGIVYEICGSDQKKKLVSMLVDTLMSGRRKQQEVTSDTQMFDSGALGKTPDGQSMSTYKELCSIANDLNQPDLIYKFMHLANHNSVWNSKKGAAFGFTTIAAQAGEQLAPYLHKIIPKLYRYQFDPNLKIQQAMSSIWSALVPKPKDTVDKYLPEILDDVQHNLISNQWRTRESSCMAVSDLLRGRALDEVVDALPVLWENLLRVRDDIKESVRNAAEIALKSLSRASIKICDPNYGKVGDKATALVLPCLLKNGLGSPVKEVQEISLATLIKISKSAGKLLKPHIPMLAVALLESLSTLEPQYLSYVSLHMASSEANLEKLDTARIAATKTSPMMDTINLCVQYVDAEVLPELIPRLTDLIKSSIGLGTKAGSSNLLISLSHQCPKELSPYAGKLLGALLNGMNDRNVTVKKSYASAIGHLVKVAKDSSVEKLILRLKEWYLTKEDDSIRQACGSALQAMNRHSPDILRRHGALALPLTFLAMHQQTEKGGSSDDSTTSVWEEVWLDATPGTEGGIRLYLEELVDISQGALQSQSWAMKAQAAATMATMADKLKSSLGAPHLGMLLKALVDGLSGRTWTGKESLLKAIGIVCTSCKDALQQPCQDQPTVDEVLAAMLKECKKENLKYKAEALSYTTDIIEAHELDRFKDISDILFPLLEKDKSKKKEKEEDTNKDLLIKFQETGYESLAKAWPTDQHSNTQELFQDQLSCLLCEALRNSFWKVELSALKALVKFVQRLSCFKSNQSLEKNKHFVVKFFEDFFPLLSQCLGKVKYSSIRTTALELSEILLTSNKTGEDVFGAVSMTNKEALNGALENMAKNDSQPELQGKASDLLKSLIVHAWPQTQ